MKSIDDTLKTIRDITNTLPTKVNIAITGGVAVILHGVERTTIDFDFCIYSDSMFKTDTAEFFNLPTRSLPKRFSAWLVQGSKIPDDPFRHDVIFIDDSEGEYERIDLLIARYKWELEGIEQAVHFDDIPFSVLSKPYLVTMKLQATGYQDYHDVVSLMSLMTGVERATTYELTKRSGRDKKLARLLSRPPEEAVREMPEEYL